MEQFNVAPEGATEVSKPQNKSSLATGWRKPTPELLQAERFADAGEQIAIPKTRAIVAAKKVAAAIGLKSQDLLLLDTFGAVTQPQDWEQGRRPIVWASNHFLMEQTGFSLATLRRHVRRLCEAGVISMKDSPNGKRFRFFMLKGAKCIKIWDEPCRAPRIGQLHCPPINLHA